MKVIEFTRNANCQFAGEKRVVTLLFVHESFTVQFLGGNSSLFEKQVNLLMFVQRSNTFQFRFARSILNES